jgi:hypothetical protein
MGHESYTKGRIYTGGIEEGKEAYILNVVDVFTVEE